MSNETVDKSGRIPRLDEVILAYWNAPDAGQPIDRHEWLDRYPDLASGLLAFFAGVDREISARAWMASRRTFWSQMIKDDIKKKN